MAKSSIEEEKKRQALYSGGNIGQNLRGVSLGSGLAADGGKVFININQILIGLR